MMAKNKCKEILVFGLSSNRGGIETYLYKIASHINREQYHLSFINMDGKDKSPCFYKELQDLGCSFFRSDSIRKNKQDLEDLFAQYHFDILHYNANTLSYIKPIIAALRHGCKVIIHSRSSGMTSRFITEALHHINKFVLFCLSALFLEQI